MGKARLEVLQNSLIKKRALFDEKLAAHIATVKQANGQPLNDKRNGQSTLNKWDHQNEVLHNLKLSIEKTERAIEYEQGTIYCIERVKSDLPDELLELINNGTLKQWSKYPNTFFVEGVEKARIVWEPKTRSITRKYTKNITDPKQWQTFKEVYNNLAENLNN